MYKFDCPYKILLFQCKTKKLLCIFRPVYCLFDNVCIAFCGATPDKLFPEMHRRSFQHTCRTARTIK